MYFTLLVVVILTAIALVAVALGIARARQTNLEGWAAPKMEAYIAKKQKLEEEQNK